MIKQGATLRAFINRHKLPDSYFILVEKWFDPLVKALYAHQKGADRPLLVGINGCQGSGKSTLADLLVTLLADQYQLKTIALSIDDFYLSQSQRQQLAKDIHPLFATRGVPGTHNVQQMQQVISALKRDGEVKIPRFDKATDNPVPENQWVIEHGPFDIVFLEGWCVGIGPQQHSALVKPVNSLEADEDHQGFWRSYVNQQLAGAYQDVFRLLDIKVMLQAPSFNCVFRWRLEQEQKLAQTKPAGSGSGIMTEVQIQRFIQHYQRLTQHALLELPSRVNYLYRLGEQREILDFSAPCEVAL